MGLFGKKKRVGERKFNPLGGSVIYGKGLPAWRNTSVDAYIKEGYRGNPIIYACVNKIASDVASVSVDVFKNGNPISGNNQLAAILQSPNPYQSLSELVEGLASSLLIAGNAYIVRYPLDGGKAVKELWQLNQAVVNPVEGERGYPLYFEVKSLSGAGDFKVPVDQSTGASDICHIRYSSDLSRPFLGQSPLEAAAKAADVFNEGVAWNKALLENGARPQGALVYENKDGYNLSEDQYARLKMEMDAIAATDNTGRPLLLDAGMSWVEMGQSAKDLDFINGIWSYARMIATCFKMPSQMIGIPGEGTYSNFEQASAVYWQSTVLPLTSKIYAEIARWYNVITGDTVTVNIDDDKIQALEYYRSQKRKDTIELVKAGLITHNEAREMLGFGRYDVEGDEPIATTRYYPIGTAGLDDAL